MPTAPFWTAETLRAYAAAHGLSDLEVDQAERMAMLANRALDTGSQIPRQPLKSTEPAATFRVR